MITDTPRGGDRPGLDRLPGDGGDGGGPVDDGSGGGDGGDGEPGSGWRWTPGRVAAAVVVVALVSMWGYVLFLAFGPGRQPSIDRLDDTAFASAGEPVCADALARVAKLPYANQSATAAERAGVIDEANATFEQMLDDLDGLATLAPAGDQRRRATEWLADWRTYLGDRQEYAGKLHSDPDARLLVSEKDGQAQQVTEWIDEFAKANHMASCVTPGDV